MRMFVYAVAVLAAAGIVVLISKPNPEKSVEPASAVVPSNETVASSQEELNVGETLVMHVPGMHCPHGCYPAVHETLTSLPGVQKIELLKQADENSIDNPRITVSYSPEFDPQAAVKALAKAGFDGSSVDHTN